MGVSLNITERWQQLQDRIWDRDHVGLEGRLAAGLRLAIGTARELTSGELTLRAMSLVYTSLLSLVPLLALAFSLLKGLGVHNRIEPLLLQLLQPLGAEAERITEMLIGFVDNVKIGVLGSVGIALLFYTVLAMIQKIESSFNYIWKIPRVRPLGQRVTDYLVVLLVGPLAISLVLGITASLSSTTLVSGLAEFELVGLSLYWLGRLLPYLLIVGVFSFVFMFIPNTRVRPGAALTGGLISGLLWQSATWGFAAFVAAASNYNAVYSSFAILILLLIWIYLAWLILLTGSQISFFIQHPEYLTRRRRHADASGSLRERLIITLLAIVQERFMRGMPALKAPELSRRSGAPPDLVNPLIDNLLSTGYLVESQDGELLPRRDLGRVPIHEVLESLGERDRPLPSGSSIDTLVNRLADELSAARRETLAGRTFSDLLTAEDNEQT